MQALSMFGGTDDIIEQMTGEAPLTVQTFIARHKDAFPWPDEVWRWVHNDGRPKGAARDIHRFLSLVSALVFWVFVISALYRVGFDGFLPPSAATVAAGAWILLSLYWYRTHVQGTLDNLWERCPEAVQDEIVAEAYSLPAGSPEDNRLRAERTIKERWGRLRERGGGSPAAL
jgi:hypothetical protein